MFGESSPAYTCGVLESWTHGWCGRHYAFPPYKWHGFVCCVHCLQVPGLVFNPMLLLHGEQDLVIHRPLQTEGTITSKTRLSDIYDTGKVGCAE